MQSIGQLKQLMFLDASKNRIECLPNEIDGCLNLGDLHLSINLLQQLPENIGKPVFSTSCYQSSRHMF